MNNFCNHTWSTTQKSPARCISCGLSKNIHEAEGKTCANTKGLNSDIINLHENRSLKFIKVLHSYKRPIMNVTRNVS